MGCKFETEIDDFNQHDRYAVAIIDDDQTVGHIPREISKICYFFVKNGGSISGEVTGGRQKSKVFKKALEVPCIYIFVSKAKQQSKKLVKLLKEKATQEVL